MPKDSKQSRKVIFLLHFSVQVTFSLLRRGEMIEQTACEH